MPEKWAIIRVMAGVEIVVAGDEVLLGLVQDTNSNYLCRVVSSRGSRVRRVCIVGDRRDHISQELRSALDRNTDLIFTCGGLGPTGDDLTLQAVADAAGVRLALDSDASRLIELRYGSLAGAGFVETAEMNEARLKMAFLPEGAMVIENPVGAAPAMALRAGRSRIVSLPGVPRELKAIVEGPLQSVLDEVLGPGGFCEQDVLVRCGDESILAPVLREVAAAYPDVYIKSRASGFELDQRFRVSLHAVGTDNQQASRAVRAALSGLMLEFEKRGVEASPIS